MSRDDSLVAASVSGTSDFQVTGQQALFGTARYAFPPWHQSIGVRPGDRSFIMPERSPEASGPEARRLVVVLNWFTDVQARFARAE